MVKIANLTSKLKNKLVNEAIGSFAIKIASTLFKFIWAIVLARLLGTSSFGLFTFALTVVYILSIPSSLGLRWLLVREVAIYRANEDYTLLKGLLKWSNKAVLISSMGITLFVLIGTLLIDKTLLTTMVLALAALPLLSLKTLRIATMQGFKYIALAELPEGVAEPLIFLCLIAASHWYFNGDINVNIILFAFLLSVLSTYILGGILVAKITPNSVQEATPIYQPHQWLTTALPFMFMGGLQIINARADILMLKYLRNTDDVAIYSSVDRGVALIVFFLGAVGTVLAPSVADIYARGEIERLQSLITKSTRSIVIVAIPIAIVFMLIGKQFLLLFGADFVRGYPALIILCIAQLFSAASGSVGVVLNMTGNEKYTAINVGINAITNIFLNMFCIPRWGVSGAALSTAATIIISNTFCSYWCIKNTGINPTILRVRT